MPDFLGEFDIDILVAENVFALPLNLPLSMALRRVVAQTGLPTIAHNHDFYWDGGKPTAERMPGEEPGSRDHFFRNVENQPFFSLFQMLYPWNGRRWIQVNISRWQSERLMMEYGFPQQRK